MAITNGYATLAEIKTRLDISDSTDDAVLESMVEAISRKIDAYCNRHFYQKTATTFYFTPFSGTTVFTPDLVTLTTLKTDEDGDRTYEVTWAATDYDKMPFNAAAYSEPYTWLATTPEGDDMRVDDVAQ